MQIPEIIVYKEGRKQHGNHIFTAAIRLCLTFVTTEVPGET